MKKDEILKALLKNEKYRLNYHLMPAKGLLNDPNGLVEKNGIYYVFYQWNDKECAHGAKKWGLYVSKDLINWEIKEIALSPEEWYETHGCYSGSGIVVEDRINLIYTGNVKNEKDERESYQCLAVEKSDGTFEKMGLIISEIPKGYTEHFRDPKVWQEKDDYYMVIGAQNENLFGEVLLYTSKELKNWKLVGSIYNKNDMGYMIECPDLFELGKETIFSYSPQGLEPQGDLYNNIFQSGYVKGTVDYSTGNFNWGNFVEFDRGFDFYAPQTFLDNKGRRIMYAWMGIEEKEHPTIMEENWVHALTMPRELKLVNNKIIQKPLEEMKVLRENELSFENLLLENKLVLDGINGDSYELIVELENSGSNCFGINLRKSENEELTIKFEGEKLILDRNKTPFSNGSRACKIEGNRHKLHIFMDKSSIEIFYNDGVEVFTSRVFSSENAKEIEFFSDNSKVLLKKIEFYKLGNFIYSI